MPNVWHEWTRTDRAKDAKRSSPLVCAPVITFSMLP